MSFVIQFVFSGALQTPANQSQLTVMLLCCVWLCAAGCRCRAERAPDASHSGRLQPHGGLRAAAGRAHHQPVLLGLSHGREEEPAVAGPQQHCALHRALAHQPRLHDLQRRLQGPLLVPPHHHGLNTERLASLYFIFLRHDCTLSPERRRQEVGPSCRGNLSSALLYFWWRCVGRTVRDKYVFDRKWSCRRTVP